MRLYGVTGWKNAGKTGGDRQRPQRERPVTRPVDG